MNKLLKFFYTESGQVLIIVSTILFMFGVAIYVMLYANFHNIPTRNIIMHQNVSIIKRDEKCIREKFVCEYVTSIGKLNLAVAAFEKVPVDSKFALGMIFGNCFNTLYVRYDTGNELMPYNIIYLENYSTSSTEFTIFNNQYNIKPTKC